MATVIRPTFYKLWRFELASLLLTDPTGRGDYKADVAAVREGNMEDPHRKIHDGVGALAHSADAAVDRRCRTAGIKPSAVV